MIYPLDIIGKVSLYNRCIKLNTLTILFVTLFGKKVALFTQKGRSLTKNIVTC